MTAKKHSPLRLCIIWLHGLGADANDFVPLVPQLHLPQTHNFRFIFPNAPVRPISINGGLPCRGWYDIYSLQDRQREDAPGIKNTATQINGLINKQIEAGTQASQIVLAGFSQGGAMALFAGLSYPHPLAGILALSAYLPLASELATLASAANVNTNILQIHGNEDLTIAPALAQASHKTLKERGYPCTYHTLNMGHEVNLAEIVIISQWLQSLA